MPRVSEILQTMQYGPAPEANDHIIAWLGRRDGRFDHFTGGNFVPRVAGEYFGVVNPARNVPLAECARGGPEDVNAAVAAARRAFPAW